MQNGTKYTKAETQTQAQTSTQTSETVVPSIHRRHNRDPFVAHVPSVFGRDTVVFNPLALLTEDLPIIYGFNNSNAEQQINQMNYGVLLAEDGAFLGSHISSNETFLVGDLGICDASISKPRHELFQEYYPEGYRMLFVASRHMLTHKGLLATYERHLKWRPEHNLVKPR